MASLGTGKRAFAPWAQFQFGYDNLQKKKKFLFNKNLFEVKHFFTEGTNTR